MGVDTGGAGDQGLMFGFACKPETPELMPLPMNWLICWRDVYLKSPANPDTFPPVRRHGSQVTIEYRDGRPFRASAIVISSQHDEQGGELQLRAEIERKSDPQHRIC